MSNFLIFNFFRFFFLLIAIQLFATQNENILIQVKCTSKENAQTIKATYKKYYYQLTISNEHWLWDTNCKDFQLKDILCGAINYYLKKLNNNEWNNLTNETTFLIHL